ncbi:MAG: valine--tRNA ligase [Alphaproteobacteria bacterium]|nr:valine--tRNA ligase [Alphaproteobacteria bacterium]
MLDKTFESKDVEKKHYELWEKSGAFTADVNSNKAPYCIPMPPPNVTGSLHMGHALNTTIQDILSRFERMQGRDVLWQPGTDHAGIATQMVVERLLGEEKKTRHDLGREKFLERVWQWKEESGNTITGQLRRLGATPDWSRERFTMDDGLNKAVNKVFVQLFKENLIYKDKRLVNWDPKLHTAISDLEVEPRETKGNMWHFKDPIKGMADTFIVIATTRPETMLGDTAVAVHPDDDRYKDLVGKMVVLPITGREIPIVADSYADPEKGSGAVKITPAHDFNDFEVGKRHKLPMISIMDKDAKIADPDGAQVPAAYIGMDRFDARKKVLEEIEALGLLEKIESHMYQVPYGDRGGVIIEPLLTDQWYVDAKTLAQPAIKAVDEGKTKFVPTNWTKTYYEWMNNIQPWCISRQIWWGHQIPAWYGPSVENGKVSSSFATKYFVSESEDAMLEEARNYYGSGVEVVIEDTREKAFLHADGIGDNPKRVVLFRDEDVLDTWFSSALWPFSTLGWPENTAEVKRYYPAETLVTGFDILFFWVARMMMMGIHFMGEVPFKTVYIHALVRDEKGQKMSKSKGNVIDPLKLIDEYGADALRFTLTSMAAQGRDVKLGPKNVESNRNFSTKLRSAARFCEMNGCKLKLDFKPEGAKIALNKWIISELVVASGKVAEALRAFRFNEAAKHLSDFAWDMFCDLYIEFTKPVFFGSDESAKQETRDTAAWVLDQLLLLLNPIMPYVTEELHMQLLGKEVSPDRADWLQSKSWPKYDLKLVDQASREELNWVVALISEIRSVRSVMNVPAAAQIRMLLQGANGTSKQRLKTYSDIIKRLARLSEAEADDTPAPKGSLQTVIDEASIVLPLADVVDIKLESARLQKEIEKANANIERINKMLNNPAFLAKAPEEVVVEQTESRAEAENLKAKLAQALKQLEAA